MSHYRYQPLTGIFISMADVNLSLEEMRWEYYQEMELRKSEDKIAKQKRSKNIDEEMSLEDNRTTKQCILTLEERNDDNNNNDNKEKEKIDKTKRQYFSDSESDFPRCKKSKVIGQSFIGPTNINDELDQLNSSIASRSKKENAPKKHKQKHRRPMNATAEEQRLINVIIELRKIGNDQLKCGDYRNAVDKYTESLQLSHGKYAQLSSQSLSNRAFALMKLNRFHEALADCESAIELNSREIKAKLRRIKCLIELERFPEAKVAVVTLKSESQFLDECDRLLAVVTAKHDFSTHLVDGDRHEGDGELTAALTNYSQAIAIDANCGRVRQMRARVYFRLERYRDALNDLNESLRLCPMDNLGPLFNRVGVLLQLERYSEAIRDAEQLWQCDPSEAHRDLLRSAVAAEKRAGKRDYYQILQVDRDASVAQIKRQYRKMALVYHPDKLAQIDAADRTVHEEKFKRLTAILATLTDPVSRRMYDMEL